MKKEVFIEKAIAVHGDKYDYSLLPDEFGTKDKVPVVCRDHGVFTQIAYNHIIGRGCNICAIKKRAEKLLYTQDMFLYRCAEKHGSRYDYSKTKYVRNGNKLIVTCKKHGDFLITPNDHLNGRGCNLCGRESTKFAVSDTLESFLDKAYRLHGDRYSYEKVEYVESSTPVKILCKVHGEFLQKPVHHLRGCHCPACATGGYNRGKSGTFYIIKVNDSTIKFGITHNINRRIKDLSFGTEYELELLHIFDFLDGNIPFAIEREIKSTLTCGVIDKENMYFGYTETTNLDNLPKILEIVQKHMPA